MMNGFDFQKILGMDSSINTTKVYFPELTDVIPNKLNYYSKSNDRISELADEIYTDGLREACVAYLDENENYILLSGETRYKSCMELVRQGKSYCYHGKDITGQIPVVLDNKPENEYYERLAITSSNNKRNSMSNNEKEEMIKNTIDDLNALAAMNRFEWSGRKTWEVVSAKTGLSGHYVRDYLSGKMTRNRRIVDSNESIKEDSSQNLENQKKYQIILRAFRNADKCIGLAQEIECEHMDEISNLELMYAARALYEDLANITGKKQISTFQNCIEQIVNSDPEISKFVYAGDGEAISEVLKVRNGVVKSAEGSQISIKNNKISFKCAEGQETVMPIARFTKLLLDYSKAWKCNRQIA